MTHTLTTNLGAGNFYSTTLANDAFESNALVLTAITFPVTSWSENLLVEETIFLWLECAVVNGFWLLYFTKRPLTNIVRRCQTNTQFIEEINI